jgi:hypothetical protein
MSLVVLKNKTAAKQKITHRRASASAVEKHWMPQGPFGPNTSRNSIMLQHGIQNREANGFVTHGSSNRSLKYIGKSSAMSTTRTPFRGLYERGHGGFSGQYYRHTPSYHTDRIRARMQVRGNQHTFQNPGVLSMKEMINRRFGWLKLKPFLKTPSSEPPLILSCTAPNTHTVKTQGSFVTRQKIQHMCQMDPELRHGAMTSGTHVNYLQKDCRSIVQLNFV